MKTVLLAMVLATGAGTLRAEIAWKWDDSNHPADTVTSVEQPISGTFVSEGPVVTEKSGVTSAFTFFTAFFDASVMSGSAAVNGTLVKRLLIMIY